MVLDPIHKPLCCGLELDPITLKLVWAALITAFPLAEFPADMVLAARGCALPLFRLPSLVAPQVVLHRGHQSTRPTRVLYFIFQHTPFSLQPRPTCEVCSALIS